MFGQLIKFWDRRDDDIPRSADTKYPLPVTSFGEMKSADDTGQVTCGNTSTVLTTKACLQADIVASSTNTERVFLKVGTVTTSNGAILAPGAGYTWGVDENLNTLHCISASGGQVISYACLVR
jgi:hypothetical protein